jgi:hypothetical protein
VSVFDFVKQLPFLEIILHWLKHCLKDQRNKLPTMAGFQIVKVPLYTGLTAPYLFMAGETSYDVKQLHSSAQNKYPDTDGRLIEFKSNIQH